MEEVIRELIQLVENIAPELWRIGLQQVYAVIWTQVFIAFMCVLLVIVSIYGIRKGENMHRSGYEMGEVIMTFGYIFMVISLFAFGHIMTQIIPRVINPEYYAILEIMNLVK